MNKIKQKITSQQSQLFIYLLLTDRNGHPYITYHFLIENEEIITEQKSSVFK